MRTPLLIAALLALAAAWATPYEEADYVFVATVESVTLGPSLMIYPPIYHVTVNAADVLPLDGRDLPAKQLSARVGDLKDPSVTKGARNIYCVAADVRTPGVLFILAAYPFSDAALADAKAALALPIGWRREGEKIVCPWTAWKPGAKGDVGTCACGRPAHATRPAGVTLTATPIPPKTPVEWQNPDGDGEYTLTVRNTGAEAVTVPGLWASAGKVLWDSSILAVVQDKARVWGPGSVPADAAELLLAPGAETSTVVNIFRLPGIEWPGGDRVELRFALGRLAAGASFYYYYKLHDPLRAAAKAPAAKDEALTVAPGRGNPRTVLHESDGGLVTLDIASPTGIGALAVAPRGGVWPKRLVLVLHIKGMEGFTATAGARKAEASLTSAAPYTISQSMSGAGTAALRLQVTPQRVGTALNTVTVEIPAAFYLGADRLDISWVDFYRG